MAQMLRHKETGELFIHTDLLSKLDILEIVPQDPIADIIKEVTATQAEEIDDLYTAVSTVVVEQEPEDLDAAIDAAVASLDEPSKKKK